VRPRWGTWLLHAALLLGAAAALAPMVWMVSASLMPTGEASAYPPRLFPRTVTFSHYADLFTRLELGRYLLNSALIATVVTAVSLAINSMAGYAFAKLRFGGRERVWRLLMMGLVIPVQVSMLPLFLLMKQLGLVNTYWGVIIPSLASIFGIFLIRQYAVSVPDELLDAARIDGAGEVRILRSIVVPIVRAPMAALALFIFMANWDSHLWPLLVASDDAHRTLPVGLAAMQANNLGASGVPTMMAAAVLALLPTLVLFLALQRRFVEGITMTAGIR